MKRIFLLIGVFVIYASPVLAQVGNDFPSITPSGSIVPSWPGRALTGVPEFGGGKGQGVGAWVQVYNRAGDRVTVRFTTDWWNLGSVLIAMFSNGDRGDMHWTDGRMFQGMCLFSCDFEFTAGNDNVFVWSEYIGCGWCFGAHLNVVSISAPVFAALSPEEKAQLTKDAAQMGQAARYFALIAATAKSFGPDMVSQLIAQLATAGALGAKWAQIYLEAAANDPDDYDQSGYDAPWWTAQQLGFEYCEGEGADAAYCNAFINNAPRIQRHGEGAYVSLNRSSGCLTVGNPDCARGQADLAKWYMRQMGDAMRDGGWYLWKLRDNLVTDVYNAECDCWLSNVLNQAGNDFWNSGEYLRNRY